MDYPTSTDARPPFVFDFEAADLEKEWTEWYQNFEIYLLAAKKTELCDAVKIALLLNQLGAKGVGLYNALKADAELRARAKEPTTVNSESMAKESTTVDSESMATAEDTIEVFCTFKEVVDAFKTYFVPRKNVLYHRYKFNTMTLRNSQSIVDFVTSLKAAAASCEFLEGNIMIRDRLISQIRDKKLLSLLLDEDSLTLDKAVELCKLYDVARMELKAGNSELHMDVLRRGHSTEGGFNAEKVKINTRESTSGYEKPTHGPKPLRKRPGKNERRMMASKMNKS